MTNAYIEVSSPSRGTVKAPLTPLTTGGGLQAEIGLPGGFEDGCRSSKVLEVGNWREGWGRFRRSASET